MDIPGAADKVAEQFSNSISLSVSPEQSKSFQNKYNNPFRRRTYSSSMPRALQPYVANDVKILLLENINQTGQDILKAQGYQVEAYKSSLSKAELIEKIK